MQPDPKQIVQAGYDAVAHTYAAWSEQIHDPERERWTRFLIEHLPSGSRVLDLGCGNGLPTTRDLAQTFDVTGVDVSARQVDLARAHVPEATIVHSDMMGLAFPDEHFAAVTAFFSIIHLPRDEHPLLIGRIAGWLQPGGYLVAVMGANDAPGDTEPDWLGAPMYWSHYPAGINVEIALNAGLEIISSDIVTILEENQPVEFHWLVCRKKMP